MTKGIEGSQVKEFRWLEKSPGAVFVYRIEGNEEIIYANQNLLELFECETFEEFVACKGGNSFRQLVYPDDFQRMEKEIKEQIQESGGDFDRIEYRIETKTGKIRLVEDFGYRIHDPKYGELFYVQIIDVGTATRYALDELTGLPRMQRFLQYLGRRLEEVREGVYEPGSLKTIYFNICNFKSYNFNFGKQGGDQVLLSVADLLKTCFPDAYLSRFTGDRFVVLTSVADLKTQVDQMQKLFLARYGSYNLKLRAGVYEIVDGEKSALMICDLAKAACEYIKTDNESLHIYDQGLNRQIEISNYVIQRIDRAVQEGDIQVFYQPVVRSISKRLCGLEALARWKDSSYGLLSPAYFIEALEESRQIHKLDLYMIRETCRQIHACMEEKREIVPVSFNLSRLDFSLCNIFEEIEAVTREFSVPRDMVNIEITESMVMDNPEQLKKEIERFRAAGYQVWMDDFGSGYSSLNILKDYQFDELKLGMEFLSSFTEISKNIIVSVIDMAKRIGIKTLAEGVETEEQFAFLKSIGCEKVQGYFFGKPMPFAEVMAHCKEKGLEMEKRGWQRYYDEIGKLHYVTDQPLAVIEDDGEVIHYLYINDKYMEAVRSSGVQDADQVEEVSNAPSSPLSKLFRSYLDEGVKDGETRSVDYTINDNYMRVYAKKVVSNGRNTCYQLALSNITKNEDDLYQIQRDHLYRIFYQMYDMVCLIDLDKKFVDPVVSVRASESERIYFQDMETIHELFQKETQEYIYPADQKLYGEFMELLSVEKRMKALGKGILTGYFRTKEMNGAYIWKSHNLLKLALEGANTYLYTVGYTPLSETEMLKRLTDQ